MGLETGSFITDLIATNPPGSDTKSQGDDHLRLLKTVLQGSFPTSSKAWYNPTTVLKTADFTVLSTEMNRTFYVDPTLGTITATLPTLAAGDAGWECHFVKFGASTNSFWIAPPSGTIAVGDLTLAKTRRVIPGIRCTAFWAGASWFASRAISVPVGTILDFDGATLPIGFEWPNGQTLAGASGSVYPDYFARKGTLVTSDVRGRASFGRDDMGGSTAGRITNAKSGVVGTTLDATGGLETTTIAQADLPNIVPAFTGSLVSLGTINTNANHPRGVEVNFTPSVGSGKGANDFGVGTLTIPNFTPGGVISSINGNVTQTEMRNLPPAIIMNKILVVE